MSELIQGRTHASLIQRGTDTHKGLFAIVDSIESGFAASLKEARSEEDDVPMTQAKDAELEVPEELDEAESVDPFSVDVPVQIEPREQAAKPLNLPSHPEVAQTPGREPSKSTAASPVVLRGAPVRQSSPPVAEPVAQTTPAATKAVIEPAPIPASAPAAPTQVPVIQLTSDQAIHILQSLQTLRQSSQPLPPNPTTVSAPILESLKNSNPQMARSLEGDRQTGALAAAERGRPTAAAEKPKQVSRAAAAEQKIQELKEQVLEQVRYQLRLALNGTQEIRMALNPGFLGNVKIRMLLEKSSLNASFLVETETVKELLSKGAQELQDLLKDSGLDLESLEVQVTDDALGSDGNSFASADDQKAVKEWQGSFFRWTADTESEPALSPAADDRLDITV